MMRDNFLGKWAFPLDDTLLEQSARRGAQYHFEAIAKDIIDKMNFEPGDVVLDLCCGNAALAQYVSRVCKEIHGIDHSEVLISAAKRLKAKNDINNLRLHLSDALRIDYLYQEDFFDKTYCYFSYQYFNRSKREQLLKKLSRITSGKGWIFLGDIPERSRMWNFYESRWKFYRERLSRLVKFREGECDLGWWVDPEEITQQCEKLKLKASVIRQEKNMPHAHYRFDVLIKNCK